MTDLDPFHSSLKDHVAHQTARLIHLLESIDYPYEISPQDVHTAITRHYLRHQHDAGNLQVNTTSKFLDWLIVNVSTESNWPGYQHQNSPLLGEDIHQDGMDDNEGDLDLEALNQEHSQLQSTLSSLEKELANLKTLETHAMDANKDLDTNIHHVSVQLDATASKLAETARATLSVYIAPEHHHQPQGQDSMDMDTDRDQSLPSPSSSPSKRFLYQCQKELLQIQKLDMEYLTTIDLLFQQLLHHHVNLNCNGSSSKGLSLSHLNQLLKRDPAQDQELVRLCSTYRATKMSHIRAMAQLRCLEEELQYMTDLDTRHQELEKGDQMADMTDQDMTTDYNMYKTASFRNQQIQQTRQQEIELITVQRETARLVEEMDQLLSDPLPLPVIEQSKGKRGGSGLNSSWGSTGGSLTRKGSGSNETLMETGANHGVLVDICERIARNDIELRFLSVVHGDYIREQEQTIKDLDVIVDQLLEYYNLGMTVEQTLASEKDMVQVHKGLLEAAVQECKEIKEQSRRLHELGKSIRPTTSWTRSDLERSLSTQGGTELIEQLKQNDDLTMQVLGERQMLQENIRQVANVTHLFKNELLYQYSSTEEIHSTPRTIYEMKDNLVKRGQELQQGYANLSDLVKEIIQQKRTPSSVMK